MKRIKNFIHQHENLEKVVLFIWGLSWIVWAKLIFRKIKHNPGKGDFVVLIPTIRTLPSTNLVYFDTIFAHAFRKLGAQAKMLFHDGALTSTDAATVTRSEKPQAFVSRVLGGLLKKSLHTDYISYWDYILPKDIAEIRRIVDSLASNKLKTYQYRGVKVGMHAHSSTIRYFLEGKVNSHDPHHISVFREKLVNAMITTKVAEGVYRKVKPNIIFMLHGIYSTWGPFFRIKNKIYKAAQQDILRNHILLLLLSGDRSPYRIYRYIPHRQLRKR